MKPSRACVRPSLAALLAASTLALSASSRAEIVERIIARVNGDIVTQSEFESRQLASVQAAHIAADQVESYLRQNNARILQEAIDDLLIVQRAADLGIKLRPEYVLEVIEGIKKENNIADEGELRKQLRREGMSLDDLKRNIERSVLRRQVLTKELEPKTSVTEAEARAVYEAHKADYAKSAAVHLQEIVVADPEQAAEVVRRARGGEDFGALARADPDRPRPGRPPRVRFSPSRPPLVGRGAGAARHRSVRDQHHAAGAAGAHRPGPSPRRVRIARAAPDPFAQPRRLSLSRGAAGTAC